MITIEEAHQEFRDYWANSNRPMTEIEAAYAFIDEKAYYHLQAQDLTEI